MRDDDDEFLRSIPPFLRRREAQRPEAQRPEARRAEKSPARLPGPAGEDPAGQRVRLKLAFDSEAAPDAGAEAGAEDVAFQVTLPRSVVRQIRVLAAKKNTTQRAIVLRALRLAGLWVPEGTDVDRRGRTAKRRQQA